MAAFFDKLIDEGKDVINPKEIITGFTIDISMYLSHYFIYLKCLTLCVSCDHHFCD